MLVVTASDSTLHRFNQVGTFVWGLLSTGPVAVSTIRDRVVAEFDGCDPRDAERDVRAFLTALQSKGLIQHHASATNRRYAVRPSSVDCPNLRRTAAVSLSDRRDFHAQVVYYRQEGSSDRSPHLRPFSDRGASTCPWRQTIASRLRVLDSTVFPLP